MSPNWLLQSEFMSSHKIMRWTPVFTACPLLGQQTIHLVQPHYNKIPDLKSMNSLWHCGFSDMMYLIPFNSPPCVFACPQHKDDHPREDMKKHRLPVLPCSQHGVVTVKQHLVAVVRLIP